MLTVDAFAATPLAPEDLISALNVGYAADPSPTKVNLGMGAYKDEHGKPWVLPVVKKASAAIAANSELNHEYNPIAGLPDFLDKASKLILGEGSTALAEKRVASIQTISGTGANHTAAGFLQGFYPFPSSSKKIHVPNPTWFNHESMFQLVGLETVYYPYYDPQTISLDFSGFKAALESAEEGSVFLVHACAHNPTGIDPTIGQWKELIEVILAKRHFIFVDAAYQGFASGSLNKDAEAVRLMAEMNVPLLICQSFSKNAGLYGHRVGALHVVCPNESTQIRVQSQIELFQRCEISCPPAWGARVVSYIMNSPDLMEEWKRDIKTMADRIILMRRLLRDELERLNTPGTWDHITNQIGMFSFTGLTPNQTTSLLENYSYYLPTSGRISMASLNQRNVGAFAKAMNEVILANP